MSAYTPAMLARKRELYLSRKLSGRCVECRTALDPNHGSVKCVDCQERECDLKQARYHTPRGQRAAQAALAVLSKRRASRVASGLCVDCPHRLDPTGPKIRCRRCQDESNAQNREHRRRQAAGIVSIKSKRIARPSLDEYVPFDELETTRIRILKTIRRFDWFAMSALFEALELPDSEIERNNITTRIRYLAKTEAVEVDRSSRPFQYRITKLGRDLLRQTFQDYELRLGGGVAA